MEAVAFDQATLWILIINGKISHSCFTIQIKRSFYLILADLILWTQSNCYRLFLLLHLFLLLIINMRNNNKEIKGTQINIIYCVK